MAKFGIDLRTGKLTTTREIIVGIDLGTTNSLIAYVHDEKPVVIPIGESGNGILPSAIFFNETGEVIIGQQGKAKRNTHPSHSIYSVKRLMGRKFSDLAEKGIHIPYQVFEHPGSGLINVMVNDKVYSPVELSSLILKEIKAEAEFILKQPILKAVITVPAYFNDAQRQATRVAGELAGFEVLRIINEPTAASMAYGLGQQKDDPKNIMVYDLGGGTFDVSVLHIENGIFEVLATHGDNLLGGDDIDVAIAKYWQELLGVDASQVSFQALIPLAERAKIHLCNESDFNTQYEGIHFSLSTEILNQLAMPFVHKTLQACRQALKDSKLSITELDEIVLVGGSSRLNLVKSQLIHAFKLPVNDFLNPDEVVALGAAVQADILAGNRKDYLLLDVTPLSMGIETLGGLMDTIIPRNSKIPLQLAKNYTTSKDGQQNIRISIYQGERELVKDNILLGEFILSGIDAMPAGLPRLEVNFSIDVDGILSVTAKELRSNKVQHIEIKTPFKIDQDEVIKRLKDSVTLAGQDMEEKKLIEAHNEAQYILNNAHKFLTQNINLLTANEHEVLMTEIQSLQNCLSTTTEAELLATAIESFNHATTPLAQRIMDLQIPKSLSGSSIERLS